MADKKSMPTSCEASPEQIRYANILFIGAWLSIVILLITYFLYVSGIIAPKIPLEKIPEYWVMNVDDYVHAAGIPIGWGWTALLGKGDYLNFIGVVLLASMTMLCFFFVLLPAYIKKKDMIFTIIVILEVLVLCVAASGILGSGGH